MDKDIQVESAQQSVGKLAKLGHHSIHGGNQDYFSKIIHLFGFEFLILWISIFQYLHGSHTSDSGLVLPVSDLLNSY